jgi:CDP-glycerol glycerophosphotransferase (TagB/SpsB family)
VKPFVKGQAEKQAQTAWPAIDTLTDKVNKTNYMRH